MAITNKDIDKLSEIFATKKDLENFATKKDLLAIKKDVIGVKDDLVSFKDEFHGFKNDILASQDKIMKKLEDISLEQKMAYSQYKRQDEKLENHERRIVALEVKV